MLLNLTRPITCTGQSPRWVRNEQERRLFLPRILMRQEKEIGSLCQPVICLPVASWLAWATCSSSALARALAGCRLGPPGTKGSHQGGKARAVRAWVCCTGTVEEKQDGNRAQLQVHGKQHPFSLAPGSIAHSPHIGLHWSRPCSSRKMLGLVFYQAQQWLGLRSSRSYRPPPWLIVPCTISIWPAVQSSVARPSLLQPQSWAKAKG